MNVAALPYVILLAFLFGSTLIASRFSVGQYAPTTYIGLRLAIAGICHLGFYLLQPSRRLPRDRRLWQHATVLGIIGTALPMMAIVTSLLYQSSGVTALLLTLEPAVTVTLAHFFLADEKLTRRNALGVVLALSGAALLAARGESGLAEVTEANPLGYFLVLLALLGSASGIIYARRYMRHLGGFDVASVRVWTAGVFMIPLSLLFAGFDLSRVTLAGYGALLYAAVVGTFAGLLLAFFIVKRFGATATTMSSNLIPVFAGVGGALLLDEQITPVMVVGLTLILLGVGILNRRVKTKEPVADQIVDNY